MSPSTSTSEIDDFVKKVPEVIPPTAPLPPPTRRSTFFRLREKIVRESHSSSAKEDRSGSTASADSNSSEPANDLEVFSCNGDSEALPPHQVILEEDPRNDTEEKMTTPNKAVPVSANIDKKHSAVDNAQGEPVEEVPSDQPGAFQVPGMNNGGDNDEDEDEDDVASSVSSVIMNVEDPPISAELVVERKQLEPMEVKRIDLDNSWSENHWKKCIGFCIILAVAVCLSISLTNAKTKTLFIELEDICTDVNDREPWLRGKVSTSEFVILDVCIDLYS